MCVSEKKKKNYFSKFYFFYAGRDFQCFQLPEPNI